MKQLPKSLKDNQWNYGEDFIVFNNTKYKTENIKASSVNTGDVIVVTNGWKVEGIGEVTDVKPTSDFNKYREVISLIYISVRLNKEDCSSYEFCEELDRHTRKVIL